MKDKALRMRLRPLYASSFLQGFVLWYAIEKFFERSIGLNDAAIALIVVILTAVMMAANIPLGVLADRWSRKGVLILSTILLIASSLIGGLSHGFWQYAAGNIAWGLFYAGYTGTYDSIIYDTLLEEVGTTDAYEHYYGRLQLADSAALVTGSLLSSAVVHLGGLRSAYFVTIVPSALAIFALVVFREPTLHRKHKTDLVGAHVAATFRAIARCGEVFWIVVALTIVGATTRLMFELDQLWLLAVALPVVAYGPVNALLLSSIGASGALAGRAKRSGTRMMGVGAIMGLAAIALLFHSRALIIVAQVLLLTGLLTFGIVFGKLLHDTMPSNIRAGASSVVTTLGYLLFLPIGVLFGRVSSRFSVFRADWIVIILTCLVFAALVFVLRSRQAAALSED